MAAARSKSSAMMAPAKMKRRVMSGQSRDFSQAIIDRLQLLFDILLCILIGMAFAILPLIPGITGHSDKACGLYLAFLQSLAKHLKFMS